LKNILNLDFSETEFYREVNSYSDSFDDGIINPFSERLVPLEELVAEEYIKKVYLALNDTASHKTVRFLWIVLYLFLCFKDIFWFFTHES